MKAIIFVILFILGLKGLQKEAQYRSKDSIQQIKYILDTIGIQNPTVVLAQWVHETAFMDSKVCRENHNLFGMKESSRHWDIGTKNGHANYMHELHQGACVLSCYMPSIYDYRDWQIQMGWKGGSDEDYMKFLVRKHYAEDQYYIEKLKFHIKTLNL